MRNLRWIVLSELLLSSLLSACGPSQAELEATAVQLTADNFATQTAQAPTATPTFTPSPTATVTPTSTPTPTKTPTITPTPPPDLMAVAPTLDDLPAGFVEMPQEFFSEAQQSMPEGTYVFEFDNENSAQIIMGMLFPVTNRAEQTTYDAMMPQLIETFPPAFGAGTDVQTLTDLDEFGESRAGITSVGPLMAITMRWDMIGFRRGEVVAILIVGYPEGDEPLLPVRDFAQLMDDRIMSYLSTGATGNAFVASAGKPD